MAKNRWLPSTYEVYIPRFVSLQVGPVNSETDIRIANPGIN